VKAHTILTSLPREITMPPQKYALEWIHFCRDVEISNVIELIEQYGSSKPRILEIGAGEGYMSRNLDQAGYDVTSTDPAPREPLCYNVRQMNGYALEFDDACYDIIVSSNVLEHIEDLPRALSEMKRILKDNGIMIHTMPSVYCNMATMLVQPLAYFRNLSLLLTGRARLPVNPNRSAIIRILRRTQLILLNYINPLRILICKGHGVSKNRFHALCTWRVDYWKRIFSNNRLEIVDLNKVPLLYSQHKIFPSRMKNLRRRLGSYFNTINIFVIKPNPHASSIDKTN